MQIDTNDMDYKLIDYAKIAQEEASVAWLELENIYNNISNEEMKKSAKDLNRSFIQTPIARDTVLIKRSIFSTSFQTKEFPVDIQNEGEESSEAARQLRIATAYMWRKSNPFVELNKAMLRMLVFPVGVVYQYWDKEKKRICIEECNPMDVCFDPEARNASDVNYLTYAYTKTHRDIRHNILEDAKLTGKQKKYRFFNKLESYSEFFVTEYDPVTFEPFRRASLTDIYIKTLNGWTCKTYYSERNILIRVAKFSECPFQWGFAREQLSSVDETIRAKQILVYGESEIDYIKEHVRAMNKRRNQHSDIVEEQINPSVYIGVGAKVNAHDLKRGAGSKIPAGDIGQIVERRAPTTSGLQDDLMMYKDDIETTSSVNGLYKAQTSGSDRRATGAIALLSSQSSTRIEEQIATANDTLFSHVAKNFVKKVYRQIDDATLKMLGIENPIIGIDHPLKEAFDFTVSVGFGSTAKRQEEYAAYMEALAALGQFQNINPAYPQELLHKAMQIKVGDSFVIDEDLFAAAAQAEAPLTPQAGGVPGGL
jgi:hypothetical protein